MRKPTINIGDRFGRLIVLEEVEPIRGKQLVRRYLCLCDCGNKVIARYGNLKYHGTRSCGCLVRDVNSAIRKFPKEAVNSRLYIIWNSAKERCFCPNSTSYKWYGLRGISMCDEWRNDFMSFYKWSIENGYSDDLTLDRINSKGNYEPSNCRWATYKEQANNTSTNLRFTYNGEEHTIHEWADIVGINAMALRHRIVYAKWPIEEALTTPLRKKL